MFRPLRITFSTVQPSKSQPIWPFLEISIPSNAKCHHRKFCCARSTQLRLVHPGETKWADYYSTADPLTSVTFIWAECSQMAIYNTSAPRFAGGLDKSSEIPAGDARTSPTRLSTATAMAAITLKHCLTVWFIVSSGRIRSS